VGINDAEPEVLKIYPNPVKDMLTIQITDSKWLGSPIKVFNSIGQLVYNSVITSTDIQVNMKSLAIGTYCVVMCNETFNFLRE
jgi:hypothetical protein